MTYRAGYKDSRERYSDRLMLLIEKDTMEREDFIVIEWNETGIGIRDYQLFRSLADAEAFFDKKAHGLKLTVI